MPTYGPNSGATFTNIGGGVSWTNPGNANASDDVYATANLLIDGASKLLRATNFSFSIPSNETIVGIKTEWEVSTSIDGDETTNSSRIVQGGTEAGTDLSDGAAWTTTDTYLPYGDSTQLWGLSWTPADINGTAFGASISVTGTVGLTVKIDHARITVYTTAPATAKFLSLLGVGS